MNRNVADAGEQVFQRFRVQGEINSVDVFAAESGVHDGRRERLRDRISGNAIDFGGGINLIDAVGALQFLRGDLPGSSFFVGGERAKREDAAGTGPEDAADDALLAHA